LFYKVKSGIEFLYKCPKCNQGEFRFLSCSALENLTELNCNYCLEYSKIPNKEWRKLKEGCHNG